MKCSVSGRILLLKGVEEKLLSAQIFQLQLSNEKGFTYENSQAPPKVVEPIFRVREEEGSNRKSVTITKKVN